jgi:hypothetical protein
MNPHGAPSLKTALLIIQYVTRTEARFPEGKKDFFVCIFS